MLQMVNLLMLESDLMSTFRKYSLLTADSVTARVCVLVYMELFC